MSVTEAEVVVVGAGLAGLRCASILAAAGREVQLWEAADDVGGRIRTDVVDGFRCDRGFQVLNPAYPELDRCVDVAALRLQPFGAGVGVRRERGDVVLAHPLRAPARLPAMLTRRAVGPRDVVALARWAHGALRPAQLKRGDDTTLAAALDRSRVSGEVRRVIDRFLSGVVLDDTGVTSNAFALLLVRTFALGVPALPAGGMAELPRQLAAPLGERVALQRRVVEIGRTGPTWQVRSDDGNAVAAREVVIATDPRQAGVWVGGAPAAMHGVVTDWWATDEPWHGPPMLWVDGRPGATGPVVNAAVISAAAPSYAPAGRDLIAASALLGPGRPEPTEAQMRAHAATILGVSGAGWEPVIRHVVPDALPPQPPPLVVRKPVRDPSGLWVCGDHRDTASIQGALVSGRRAAEGVLRALA
ncbi:FAD-dependent oxidoreductase [Mycolicibacterium sp. 018/SC-01/001]|uniref:flavin monoamine oxidase family protein n=1 Tax=Mycolicibacterium sp. 018/SC-01/001 TaxID=2592069 RepID=UPI00117C6166|nr:FAD-dependent oxidoreductase [Mycolicibacterium sp. 018/SC-01/001]TRW83197.1 FAD-dependent oxidoreductase [Mycolicibacterium sp. 018/SC-01/001]